MRVLFVCLPREGHLAPLLPIAQALLDVGHKVAFATAAGFIPQVVVAGFEAFPGGFEYDEWMGELAKVWESMPDHQSDYDEILAAFGEHAFAGTVAMRLIQDLPDVLKAWPADLIVHEDLALGAAIAAEQLGVPHARVMILAAGPGQATYAHIDRAVARLRAAVGLSPASAAESLHPHLFLYPFPPSLLLPGMPVPAVLRPIRPALPNLTPDDKVPDWLVAMEKLRPLVYATLGTVQNHPDNDGIFAALIAALGAEPIDAVLTVGRDRDPATFAHQPSNVRVMRFVSIAALMPQCDAVVNHGGSGTVVAALACGLPQVILPLGADQFENAKRVAALGAAIVVDDATSADAIQAALHTVLSEPNYRLSAKRIQAEIEALPGPDEVVVLLERVAASYSRPPRRR